MYHNWNRSSQQAREGFDFQRIIRNAILFAVLCAWTFDWKYSINLQANQCSLEKQITEYLSLKSRNKWMSGPPQTLCPSSYLLPVFGLYRDTRLLDWSLTSTGVTASPQWHLRKWMWVWECKRGLPIMQHLWGTGLHCQKWQRAQLPFWRLKTPTASWPEKHCQRSHQ